MFHSKNTLKMKNILKTTVLAFITIYFISCEDLKFGDAFLEKAQSQEINLDSIFSKKIYAEQALSQVYKSLPFGLPTGTGDATSKIGLDILESLTDLQYSTLSYGGAFTSYYTGSLTPSTNPKNTTYNFVNGGGWDGIRDAYIFINNIDRVPDMTAEEKAIRKAEAKMIVAIHYAEMFRYFGGLPLVDKVYSPEDQPQLPRMTVEATLNHIVTLLNEVATVLPWKIENPVVDDGRMTAAAAMGLKVRVLLFAASPLFNDNEPYLAGDAADKKLVWFGAKSTTRWNDVKVACEDFITRLNNESAYSLVNTGSPRDDFRKAYYERNNGEVLISTRKGYKGYTGTFFENVGYGTCNPTLDYVNMFPMKDGSDFDWNNATAAQYPFFDATGNPIRDPRLYESILINGDVYQGRKAELYIGGRERITDDRTKGIAATGFVIRKFRLDVNSASGTVLHWPYLRLPEIYLSYAEALNEINGGPTTTAYEMINKTRDRVAVGHVATGLNQTQFREAILRERALEFGFEEVRYFDIIRWKRQDIMQKKNYGLTIKSVGSLLTFEQYEIPITRDWQSRWNAKWYLTPFPIDEVNKGYGISQNPGW